MEIFDLQAKIGLDSSDFDNGLNEASEKSSTFGDVLKANLATDTIKNGLSSIKDGVVNLATSSVDAWHEVDDGMDTITQKTGATGDALADMQDRAKNIAETIPTSFEDAGTAVGEVNTRFGVTGDKLEELSTQFIEFANLNNTDVNSSIDNVQKALSAFGLSADDAGSMLDALNVAGQESGVSVDQLSQNLVTNATAFQSMGFSAQDSINLLSTLEKSGVDTSTVMTGLSKVQKSAMADGVSMQDEFKKALSSSSDAVDVFGAKAGPKLYEAFQNGTLSIEDFTAANASLDESLGSVSSTYEDTLDPLDKLTTAQNKLKDVQAQLVDAVMPALLPLIEKFSDYIGSIDLTAVQEKINSIDFESITNKIQGLFDIATKVTDFVLNNSDLIVAALGTIGVAMGAMKIMEFINAIQGVVAIVPGLISGIGGVVAAIGPVALVIAGVVAAGVLLYQNWDTIKEKAGELKDWIGEKWDGIKEKTSEAWENVKTTVSEKWDALKTAVAESDFGQAVGQVWEAAKQTTQDNLNAIRAAYDEHGGGMQGAIAAVGEAIKQQFTTVYDFLNNLTNGKFGEMLSVVQEKMSSIGDAIKTAWDNAKQAVSTVLGAIKSTVSTIWTAIQNTISTVMNAIKNTISTVWNGIKSTLDTVMNGIKTTVTNIWNGIKSAITTVVDGIKSGVSSGFNAVSSTVSNIFNGIKGTATTVWNAIKNAITSPIEAAKEGVRNAINAMKGFFNFSWSLPRIKLPHFSISGRFSLNPPSVPHFGISWYKKAMEQPYLFDHPTLFGAGDAGDEVMYGRDNLMRDIKSAVASVQTSNTVTINVYGAEGQSTTELAQKVSDIINKNITRRKAAFA